MKYFTVVKKFVYHTTLLYMYFECSRHKINEVSKVIIDIIGFWQKLDKLNHHDSLTLT